MRTRVHAVLAGAAFIACSGGAEYHPTYSADPIVGEAPAAQPGRFVLVARNGWLYTAASDDAERARAFPQRSDPGSPIVYRFVRELPGGWTKIETVDPAGDRPHCEAANLSLGNLRLRLYARTTDLSLTTTREIATRFADGTSITLAAGVPLLATGRSTPQGQAIYTAYADFMFNTWVDETAVGHRYDPTRHFELTETGDVVSRTARLVFGQTGELRPQSQLLSNTRFVYARRDIGGAALVTLRTRCGQFEVTTDAANVTRFPGYLGMLSGSMDDAIHGPFARANARAYWVTGRHAGSVRRDVGFDGEIDGIEGRRCFRKSLRLGTRATEAGAEEHILRLCFDAADIGVAPPAAAPSAVDAGTTNPVTGSPDASVPPAGHPE